MVVSIVASAVSSRLGAPLLLVFLVLGMLAGEDGPGGIKFDDVHTAQLVGSIALAIIIFDGGLRTRREVFRVALWPAVSLATVGVVVTAVIVAVFATWLMDLHWMQGMLIGAIVGSTDAAAVFSLLQTSGTQLKERVASTLEIESASNDPMAIFMALVLIDVLAAGGTTLTADVLIEFFKQFGTGIVVGWLGGRLLGALINRLNLVTALYPLLAVAGGVFVFAAAASRRQRLPRDLPGRRRARQPAAAGGAEHPARARRTRLAEPDRHVSDAGTARHAARAGAALARGAPHRARADAGRASGGGRRRPAAVPLPVARADVHQLGRACAAPCRSCWRSFR